MEVKGQVSYVIPVSKDGVLKLVINSQNFHTNLKKWFKQKYGLQFENPQELYFYLRDTLKLEYILNNYKELEPYLEHYIKKHIFNWLVSNQLELIKNRENIVLRYTTIINQRNHTNDIKTNLYYRTNQDNGKLKYLKRISISLLKVLVEERERIIRDKKQDDNKIKTQNYSIFKKIIDGFRRKF